MNKREKRAKKQGTKIYRGNKTKKDTGKRKKKMEIQKKKWETEQEKKGGKCVKKSNQSSI